MNTEPGHKLWVQLQDGTYRIYDADSFVGERDPHSLRKDDLLAFLKDIDLRQSECLSISLQVTDHESGSPA